MNYTDMKYVPTTSSEVLRIKPIEKDFIELGELSIRVKKGLIFNNQEEVVTKLKEKAMEIGADAIIILGEETEGSTVIDNDNNTFRIINRIYLKSTAIKYIN